jgi:hypothetical protein
MITERQPFPIHNCDSAHPTPPGLGKHLCAEVDDCDVSTDWIITQIGTGSHSDLQHSSDCQSQQPGPKATKDQGFK